MTRPLWLETGTDPAQKRPSSRHDALFGGRGEVRVVDLLGDRSPPPFAAALACELDPGGAVGMHVQTECCELVIFIEGRGVVVAGPSRTTVGPGSVVPLPLGMSLAIENTATDAPLRYLIVKAVP
jgi:mannose-6-phosphate isomerase-like protein (cupin superfamily)